MGSFALRDPRIFAYEWASLDLISGGRTILCVCSGGGAGPEWEAETAAMGIAPAERRKRMIENMAVLRHLWSDSAEPFEGDRICASSLLVNMIPKPLQSPCPIWLTTNAGRLDSNQVGAGGSDFALRRVGRVADGWMMHSVTPEGFRRSLDLILDTGRAAGRNMDRFAANIVTAVLNIQDEPDAAVTDAKRYLDLYYGANYSVERLHAWGPLGTPSHCATWIRRFLGTGCEGFTFRLATMGDAAAQLRRLTEEVLPLVSAA